VGKINKIYDPNCKAYVFASNSLFNRLVIPQNGERLNIAHQFLVVQLSIPEVSAFSMHVVFYFDFTTYYFYFIFLVYPYPHQKEKQYILFSYYYYYFIIYSFQSTNFKEISVHTQHAKVPLINLYKGSVYYLV
jgi:hypothetical protein